MKSYHNKILHILHVLMYLRAKCHKYGTNSVQLTIIPYTHIGSSSILSNKIKLKYAYEAHKDSVRNSWNILGVFVKSITIIQTI